jgi:BirA family biotin operon repressor/biotin-[acetyl-CoA-carboxylase] ligase
VEWHDLCVATNGLTWKEVGRHFRGRFGRPYTYVDETESTQLLLEGAPEGAVAATDLQTAGRGRHGRVWEAPAGTALLCSVVLHPPTGCDAPELTLVGAIAAAEAIEAATSL